MATLTGFPLTRPLSPASSFNKRTQNPAMAKITTLVYTGIDRFIIKSIPPRIGAIMPPLLQEQHRFRLLQSR